MKINSVDGNNQQITIKFARTMGIVLFFLDFFYIALPLEATHCVNEEWAI